MEEVCPELAKRLILCHCPKCPVAAFCPVVWTRLQTGSGITPPIGSGGEEGGTAAAHRDWDYGLVWYESWDCAPGGLGLHLLLVWGDQRGAEVPNQALRWERDKCSRVSSDTESGSGGCQPRLCRVRELCENSFSVACALIHYPHFQFPLFLKRCWKVREDTEHVSGVKQFEKSKEILISVCS